MSSPTYRKLPVCFKPFLMLSFLLCALSTTALGQAGVSSAAESRTRYLAESGVLPASREVAVEEIINYRRHQIGLPKAGQSVALDVRWGNDQVAPGQEAVLQVGFTTSLAIDREQLRPVNLALVIDKSGSMADADKMSRVKAALLTMVGQLRESDVLSIVVFDSEAEVLMPAQPIGNREDVRRLIRSIEPGSSTNIHAGLMLGYHQALVNYRRDVTNRVILLTDGIANTGVTDPTRISRDSLAFNDRGIDLSTIGVGLDLNKDLLRILAKSGRGLFHFVADAQDIEKVFLTEVQSLVSPVATTPNVEIDFDPGLELVQLYGYEPQFRRGGVRVKLDNMNSGLTQVVMMRVRPALYVPGRSRLSVRVRLSYYDLARRRQVVESGEASVAVRDAAQGDMLDDGEVDKNYSIALLAQAIRDMAAASEAGRFREAENLLTVAINRTSQRYPNLDDEDIRRTLSTAQKYQEALRRQNQRTNFRRGC
ncbi:MAG TPA: VWA domain-containing protein [Pyrinomonadaceae bacterium]|nr:VWA domain-containing protein [Pyrinomonadaceae bacterium]